MNYQELAVKLLHVAERLQKHGNKLEGDLMGKSAVKQLGWVPGQPEVWRIAVRDLIEIASREKASLVRPPAKGVT
jgi:hypothetical protein